MDRIERIDPDRTVPRVELTRLTALEREEQRRERERRRRRKEREQPRGEPPAAGGPHIDIRV